MSDREKFAASKDMLTFLRARDRSPTDSDVAAPSHGLIEAFQRDMADACSLKVPGLTLAKAAQHAYIGDPQFRS